MQGISDVLSIAGSGLNAASSQLAATARKISDFGVADSASDSTASGSPNDLAGNIVDLLGERTLYQANAVVLKTTDRLLGTLLDLLDTDHQK